MKTKRNSSQNHNHKCSICRRPAKIDLSLGKNFMRICKKCNKHFFFDLSSKETKQDRLLKAKSICGEKGLTIGYALNVCMGRYTLQEAKRRCKLNKREQSGKSVDIFDLARRMPGGYRG